MKMDDRFKDKVAQFYDKIAKDFPEGNPHEEVFSAPVGIEFPNEEPEQVGFKRLNENATIPTKAHATDSGYDMYASEDVIIEPGDTAVVPTGIAVQLPEGMEAQVRPRSGVTSRTKLRVQLGTIDNGYSGEIGVIVDNISTDTWSNASRRIDNTYDEDTRDKYRGYIIRKHDRIAQLVVQYLPQVEAVEIDGELTETDRGSGGFGSTDKKEEVHDYIREAYK